MSQELLSRTNQVFRRLRNESGIGDDPIDNQTDEIEIDEHTLAADSVTSTNAVFQFRLGLLILFLAISFPLSICVVVFIIRRKNRWTMINLLIAWSRTVSLLGLIVPLSKVIENKNLDCISSHLLLPALVLHEKVAITLATLVRFLYIFCGHWFSSIPLAIRIIFIFGSGFVSVSLPFITMFRELPPLYQECAGIQREDSPSYNFLFSYLVIWLNSLLVDMYCFVRIVNYMRLMKVRVNVVAVTPSETKLMVNVINSTSSLLIWLVVCVCMIPTLILQYRSPTARFEIEEDIVDKYNHIMVFVLNVVVPVLIIGSSTGMRDVVSKLRRQLDTCTSSLTVSEAARAEIYTISDLGALQPFPAP